MNIAEAHPRLKDPVELKRDCLKRALSSTKYEGLLAGVKALEEDLAQFEREHGSSTIEATPDKIP